MGNRTEGSARRRSNVRLGSFWVSLAPMPVWTCRKCCWLLLFCVCLCVYLCLRRWGQWNSLCWISGWWRIFPCYLSEALMLLIPYNCFSFDCNVPPPLGLFEWTFEPLKGLIICKCTLHFNPLHATWKFCKLQKPFHYVVIDPLSICIINQRKDLRQIHQVQGRRKQSADGQTHSVWCQWWNL